MKSSQDNGTASRVDRLIRFFEYQKTTGLQWISGRGPAVLASGSAIPSPREGEPVTSLREEDPVAALREETPLAALREEVLHCTRCRLSEGRTQAVFGVGNENARLMFVGEAPGQDEDRQGEPFVGRAGQLLTKMIEAIHLRREDVFIANVIKCRPPNNRNPEPDEIFCCEPYLIRQIELIRPKLICALGSYAAKTLLKTDQGITRLRGRFFTYQGVKLLPTFHPAYLLRNPNAKKEAWEDLKLVMREYRNMES